jgi:hypothetical protein
MGRGEAKAAFATKGDTARAITLVFTLSDSFALVSSPLAMTARRVGDFMLKRNGGVDYGKRHRSAWDSRHVAGLVVLQRPKRKVVSINVLECQI